MSTIRLFFMSGLFAIVLACNPKSIDSKDYVRYFEDKENGLIISNEVGEIRATLFYKSYEYQFLKQGQNEILSYDMLNDIKMDSLQYFTIRIESLIGNDILTVPGILNSYYERLEYLKNNVCKDFWIIEGEDTIPCLMSHFEQNYNMVKHINIEFVAKTNYIKGNKKVIYNDKVFGLGALTFLFEENALNNIPSLKI